MEEKGEVQPCSFTVFSNISTPTVNVSHIDEFLIILSSYREFFGGGGIKAINAFFNLGKFP